MVTRYGMDEALGSVVYQGEPPLFLGNQPNLPTHREVSSETAEKIDQAVRTLVQAAFDNAKAILLKQRDMLERGAQMLLTQETLTEPELATLQESLPVAAAQSANAPGNGQ